MRHCWTLIGQIEVALKAQDRAGQAFTRAIAIDSWQLDAHGDASPWRSRAATGLPLPQECDG
ncbi:MAG TPA: hypothetical protein PKN13_10155 [Accumulibacter sp.]|nr:hypothetical protein [Accumulibacter sp.]HMW18279.1 hypothetical protein [Accumulibacter sp.]HNC17164.1 hypothetical protein [Accumulibacter sp.]HNE13921.1 hypothetical protein [Accumulibacter sp.]HNI72639.1 hypothetical protein [Accumulibacter sp.]